MLRLFISHSGKDNVEALAFRNWLVAGGWSAEDVFIDLHGIDAGERWRDRLRKANALCEAVILLASPNSVDSRECQREMNLAEDLGKEIIVAILRGVAKDDARLARYADRQLVDLSQQPTERMEPFEHDGRLHRVEFHGPALAAIKARLAHLGIAPGSFAWTPRAKEAGPYPGLAAFGEDDAGIFFGREADIMTGMTKLRLMRRRRVPRLLVIVAASGAGKSSYLKAGLWPRLKRDPDFAPLAVLRPALGILTGPDGLGRRIAPWFERHGRTKVPGEINAKLAQPGTGALLSMSSLLSEATQIATMLRRTGAQDARPPAPLIAIDQGEELFAAENAAESGRFLELLAAVLKEPPPEADPYVLVTIRADSVEALLQRWPALGLETPESHHLPPLPPSAYRDVIVKPAEVYTERVRRLVVEPALADALARDATGADALPLLAFTLEKLFHEFGTDGNLTVERYDAMGGIGGSIDRALAEAQRQAGPVGTAEHLRRLMVPGLATWDMSANAAKRIVAQESEVLGGGRTAFAPLADALVANRLLTRGAGTLEVAHEALLRRAPVAGWLEEQKDLLKLRDDVLREAGEWADAGKPGHDLPRRGARLESALALQKHADFASALAPAKDYLAACRRLENAGRRKARWAQGAIFTLMLAVIGGLLARIYERELRSLAYWATTFRGYQLAAADSARLKPGDPFQECAKTFSDDRQDGKQIPKYCPEMVVIPAGSYKMGGERSSRIITIKTPFAVSRFTITFDQWDTCVAGGGCENNTRPADQTWGRGSRPVIYVDWRDAQNYVAWLNRMTGTGSYRLLSEAEWEYAARGVTSAQAQHRDYPWGDEIGKGNANCDGCGSQWDNKQTAPVGSFKDNAFGLYDMHGNVWQWVEDCYAEKFDGAPSDGAAWKEACTDERSSRVVRGGSWDFYPDDLRSSNRSWSVPVIRDDNLGFRVARVLSPAGTLLPP